jgi:hypothetical protein
MFFIIVIKNNFPIKIKIYALFRQKSCANFFFVGFNVGVFKYLYAEKRNTKDVEKIKHLDGFIASGIIMNDVVWDRARSRCQLQEQALRV